MNYTDKNALLIDFANKLNLYNRSELTIKGYKDQLENYLNHFNRNPKTITVTEAIEYLIGVQVHSRKTAIAALKFFYSECLNSDKFNKLKYPKIPEYVPDVLSVDEVKRLIAATANVKHKTIIMLLYSTGMRVSEVINLKWSHVDRANMTIQVKQAKGQKDRPVKLTAGMLAQLVKYCKAYGLGCFESTNYVFKGQGKARYSRRSIETFMEKSALLAGISKRVSPHILRHCAGMHWRAAGVKLEDIQEMMGHKSAKTTKIYSRLSTMDRVPDLVG